MKFLLIFLLGMVAGAFSWELYNQRNTRPAPVTAERPLSDKARTAAADIKDSVSNKLADWHLTSDDIKADLAKTGQVVRRGVHAAGEKISDARVIAVVKAKFVLDRDLSALDINIDSADGDVTLRGTVATHELIGRAVALALDTDGVRNVTSKLAVK